MPQLPLWLRRELELILPKVHPREKRCALNGIFISVEGNTVYLLKNSF
jgi:hypothetical protein